MHNSEAAKLHTELTDLIQHSRRLSAYITSDEFRAGYERQLAKLAMLAYKLAQGQLSVHEARLQLAGPLGELSQATTQVLKRRPARDGSDIDFWNNFKATHTDVDKDITREA